MVEVTEDDELAYVCAGGWEKRGDPNEKRGQDKIIAFKCMISKKGVKLNIWSPRGSVKSREREELSTKYMCSYGGGHLCR